MSYQFENITEAGKKLFNNDFHDKNVVNVVEDINNNNNKQEKYDIIIVIKTLYNYQYYHYYGIEYNNKLHYVYNNKFTSLTHIPIKSFSDWCRLKKNAN